MAQRGGALKDFYHYTTKENAEKIQQEGVIQPSEQGYYGPDKVYMTTTGPSQSNAKVLNAMCDSSKVCRDRAAQGKTDVAIGVRLDDSRVTKENTATSRDVYSHKGPLDLASTKSWEVIPRKK